MVVSCIGYDLDNEDIIINIYSDRCKIKVPGAISKFISFISSNQKIKDIYLILDRRIHSISDIDEKSSILHFMPYLDCESMLVAIRYINNFVMSKMGCSYETIKKPLFDVVNDISVNGSRFINSYPLKFFLFGFAEKSKLI